MSATQVAPSRPDIAPRPGAEARPANDLLYPAAGTELIVTDGDRPDLSREQFAAVLARYVRRRSAPENA